MRLGFPGKQLGEIKGGGNGRGSHPTTRGIYKLAGNPLLPILHICFRQLQQQASIGLFYRHSLPGRSVCEGIWTVSETPPFLVLFFESISRIVNHQRQKESLCRAHERANASRTCIYRGVLLDVQIQEWAYMQPVNRETDNLRLVRVQIQTLYSRMDHVVEHISRAFLLRHFFLFLFFVFVLFPNRLFFLSLLELLHSTFLLLIFDIRQFFGLSFCLVRQSAGHFPPSYAGA